MLRTCRGKKGRPSSERTGTGQWIQTVQEDESYVSGKCAELGVQLWSISVGKIAVHHFLFFVLQRIKRIHLFISVQILRRRLTIHYRFREKASSNLLWFSSSYWSQVGLCKSPSSIISWWTGLTACILSLLICQFSGTAVTSDCAYLGLKYFIMFFIIGIGWKSLAEVCFAPPPLVCFWVHFRRSL